MNGRRRAQHTSSQSTHAQTIINQTKHTSHMFSLLYGVITGVEYFSDDDEASSFSSSSENAKQLSSSLPWSSLPVRLSQTTARSFESPQPCSIERSSTGNLTNNMIGRYHDRSHGAVSSGSTSSLGSWHHGNDSSSSPNAKRLKLMASSQTPLMEIQSAKGRCNEATGSCRRRHRSPTP